MGLERHPVDGMPALATITQPQCDQAYEENQRTCGPLDKLDVQIFRFVLETFLLLVEKLSK